MLLQGERASSVEEVQKLMEERNLMFDELKFQLTRAQNKMKSYADQGRRDVVYEVGDKVYLKIQPYRLKTLARRVNQKLSPR